MEATNSAPVKQKPVALILLILVLVLLIAGNLLLLYSNNRNDPGGIQPTPAPTPLISPGRLQVNTPLSGAVLPANGGDLNISGKMKDFFEATVSFKVLNANGAVLYQSSVTAASENYGKFANFSKTITIPAIPAAQKTASAQLVFYDVNMGNGAETKLLTVPLTVN